MNLKNKSKIILVGNTDTSFINFRTDLMCDLINNGHEVYAFISEFKPEGIKQIENMGVRPIIYKMSRSGINPFSDLLSLLQLYNKIKKINADVVFSFFAKPVIYGSLAAKFSRVANVVGMLEGLGYTFTEQPDGKSFKTEVIKKLQIILYRFSFLFINKLVFLNVDDKKDLIDKYNIKVKGTYILGGIGINLDLYSYYPAPTENINFLFIGRLLKEKGIFDFIEAVKVVKKKYPHASFTVLGSIDTGNLGALTQETLDLLLEQNLFEYVGYVDNVSDWIKRSSVFVLPSYREGVPRSTQEAMAIGRPVITTDVPGCRETVEDGINGFLVPKWNAQALADKMCFFIENPEQINIMGRESYKIACEKFDVHTVNKKLFKILGIDN